MVRATIRTLRRLAPAILLALPTATGCVVLERDSPCGDGIPYCGELFAATLGCPSDGSVECCRWDADRDDWVKHRIAVRCDGPDAWEPVDPGRDPGPQDVPVSDPSPDPAPDTGPDVAPDAPDVAPDIPTDVTDVPPTDVPPSDVPDVPPLPARLVLDPDSLTFYDLPIGSIRFAVSGHDPEARTCVTLVWDFSNTDRRPGPFCDDFGPGFPYAIVRQDTDGPCADWNYGGSHPVLSAEGCLDWAGFGPDDMDYANVVAVLGPADRPTEVVVDNRSRFDVPPVFLGLSFFGTEPAHAWVQTGDDYGLPTWVQVMDDDGAILMLDRCDLPVCGQGGGVCGIAWHRALDVMDGRPAGGIWLAWDGMRRVPAASGDCWERVPVPDGAYVARFCWARTIEEGDLGPDLVDPHCSDVPFQLPAERVGMQVSFEG